MPSSYKLKKLAAFTTSPAGGNPAGVWIGETLPTADEMQQIAGDIGFSETVFVAPSTGSVRTVRYFSPEAEVAFCGHATIAAGVALGRETGGGTYQFDTTIGRVPVVVGQQQGELRASLTAVETKFEPASASLLARALSALRWSDAKLDPCIAPARAFGGNWHLVIAVASKSRLDDLDYDFEALKTLMLDDNLTTLQLIWRASDQWIHSRNPFPIGGVVEDPATGAAAAALGGYLREAKIIQAPMEIDILQGEKMGRPSHLQLSIPVSGGIRVSGTAVDLQSPADNICD